MATITKTPSGTWKAIIRKIGWPTASKTFRNKRDAQDWARNTEDEMVRGTFIRRSIAEKLLFPDALARYGREITTTKKSSTQARELRRFQNLIDAFGPHSLASITPDMVARHRDKQLAQGKANNTVRLELALMSHLFTIAIQEWGTGLTVNPVALIKKPNPGKGRDRRLTSEELDALTNELTKDSNPMVQWITAIALETGMRASEITGLTTEQVDIQRRIVRLYDTKNNDSRTVPLSLGAVDAFDQAINHPARLQTCSDLVFPGEVGRGGKRSPYNFQKAWQKAIKSLGFVDFHFHDLRHEAVSRLVEGGLSDQEVASISGHKSMQMLRRYTHLRAEDLVDKLDAMNNKKS